MLLMQVVKRIPQQGGIVTEFVATGHASGYVEAGKAPVTCAWETGLVVAGQTSGNLVSIAYPVKGQFLNHQPSDDLGLACTLQRCLDGQQLLLSNQKSEQPNLNAVQVIMDITQPFVFILVVALGLIGKENYCSAAIA